MNKTSVKKLSIYVLKLILYTEASKGFDVLFVLSINCNFLVFMDFHSACCFSSHSVYFHLFQMKLYSPSTEDKD